jgi:hypothetical protein
VSPALEFVKAATHVMGLDPHLAQEVAGLRRLLLTQVVSSSPCMQCHMTSCAIE